MSKMSKSTSCSEKLKGLDTLLSMSMNEVMFVQPIDLTVRDVHVDRVVDGERMLSIFPASEDEVAVLIAGKGQAVSARLSLETAETLASALHSAVVYLVANHSDPEKRSQLINSFLPNLDKIPNKEVETDG